MEKLITGLMVLVHIFSAVLFTWAGQFWGLFQIVAVVAIFQGGLFTHWHLSLYKQ